MRDETYTCLESRLIDVVDDSLELVLIDRSARFRESRETRAEQVERQKPQRHIFSNYATVGSAEKRAPGVSVQRIGRRRRGGPIDAGVGRAM